MLIACDGSSFRNGDPETPIGWAWAREDGAWMSNGMIGGSNNRAELHGIISVLLMNPHDELTVLMDSQYALNTVDKWIYGWARNNWIKKDNKPVQNVDLVKVIHRLRLRREAPVTFQWVKAHRKNSHELNVRADELAGAAMRRVKNGELEATGMAYLDSKGRTHQDGEFKVFTKLYSTE